MYRDLAREAIKSADDFNFVFTGLAQLLATVHTRPYIPGSQTTVREKRRLLKSYSANGGAVIWHVRGM